MSPFPSNHSYQPTTRRSDHCDQLHGQEITDPYRWLEDVDSLEIAEWIKVQNDRTRTVLSSVSSATEIRQRVEVLASFETTGMPQRGGNRLFFTLQLPNAKQPSLVWRETDSEIIHTLVDPSAMAADATVSVMGFSPSPTGRYVAYGLAEAGSDWQTWHVLDADTGEHLSDKLQWIRFTVASWREDESGFFYTGSEPPPEDEVYKAPVTKRSIRFHRLGDPQSQDKVVYDRQDEPGWMSYGRVTADDRFLVITTQLGTHRKNRVSVLSLAAEDTPITELVSDFEAAFNYLGQNGSHLYFWTNLDAPHGRIVSVDVEHPQRAEWQETVAESEGVIESVAYVNGCFIVSALVDAESRVRVYASDGVAQHDISLPGRGSVPVVEGKSDGTDVYLWYSDPARPGMVLRHDLAEQTTEVFRGQQLPYDPDDFITERHIYQSADGTDVPIFISRKKTTVVNPQTPTCLYGYGGFNISQSPGFRLDHLTWMDLGGQLAVACIRGGGEFGHAWHQAGACEKRPNVFADFIAAAEWLIDTERTSTPKLVIHGRSNGGLLVGACMTKRPDLFGACLPGVGVLDMLRFHKFTVGAFWVSDYGSPDDPDMFPILLGYSPLHNVRDGTAYPPTLVTTADHDDRVFPAHSFKFAAALQHAQAGDAPILLRVEERAGHGMGKPKGKLLDEIADNWTFAFAALDAMPTLC